MKQSSVSASSAFSTTCTDEWGVAAHGATLHIESPFKPTTDVPQVIDIENNKDKSCAGIGVTTTGRDIHFYSTVEDKDFFKSAEIIGHNVKYDVQMLRSWGFNVSPDQIVWDTQVAEYVRNSTTNTYGLKDLGKSKFGFVYPDYKTLCGAGKKAISIGEIPIGVRANYNGDDVLLTHKIKTEQLENMRAEEKQYMEIIELPTLRVLLEMEERGVQIDTNYIRDLDKRFEDGISGVVSSIRRLSGAEINLNSHQQIKRLILDKVGIALPSTAAEELEKHASIPLIKDILRYRQLNKLRSTYTQGLLERSDGKDSYRLHARFNQTVTHTGRLSSSDPNLQNIPTRTDEGDAIREGFIAKPGHVLIDADYGQKEPRIITHFSDDPELLRIFRNDEDLYDSVAELIGCTRQIAKILWLAIAYNAGPWTISKTAGISVKEAERFLNQMRTKFERLFYWKDQVIAEAEINGFVITMFGRKIPLPADLAHLAPNYKVQGSAAEVMKLAIAATRDFNAVLTVHDELLFELPQGGDGVLEGNLADISELMTSVITLKVPLKVDLGFGPNWRVAKNG